MKIYSEKQKSIISRYTQFSDVVPSDIPLKTPEDSDVINENPLLDVIYGLDEKTNLPKGDISLFLSDRTSPEVRSFISQSLHTELPDSPSYPADADLDFTRYMREKGESRNDYLSRMQKVIKEDKLRELELSKKSE